MALEKKHRNILIIFAVVLVIIIAWIVYKVWFQFDNSTVQSGIATAANNDPGTIIILNDAVKHIMGSSYLTQEVLDYASMTNTPKEQVLVNAAMAQAKSMGYIA